MAKKITSQRQRFVDNYIISLNATTAALAAGYSKKSAGQMGHNLLQEPVVIAAIDEAIKARNERLKINADYVLNRLVEIDKMDALDILKDDGTVKPVKEWPKIWRQFISGMDISELASGDTIAIVKKIKWPDKVKNLELIGNHVQVQAFKKDIDLNVKETPKLEIVLTK